MAIATVINYGQVLGILLLGVLLVGGFIKAKEEEAIMSKYFPEDYPEYKHKVHAIIPFLI
jgi:protein-S-isoprenylcysteine O-methyltransferase Ste14